MAEMKHLQGWLSFVPAVSAAIAAIAACLSIVFFFLSQRNTKALASEARRNKLLPLIVFYRRPELVWILKNVGEGTAIKVFVRNYSAKDQVRDEMELYPVVPGEAIRLDYLEGPAEKLIAMYVNVLGEDPHHTICSNNTNDPKRGEFKGDTLIPGKHGHESQIHEWPVTRLS